MKLRSYKILLLGAMAVGKTSIANRLAHNTFSGDYKSTIGVHLYEVEVALGEQTAKAVLWDTDGDMDTSIFRSPYVLGATGAIIVSDVMRPRTIDKMVELSRGMDEALPGRPSLCVINKTDLNGPEPELLQRVSAETDFVSTCSALSGEGVVSSLQQLMRRLGAFDD